MLWFLCHFLVHVYFYLLLSHIVGINQLIFVIAKTLITIKLNKVSSMDLQNKWSVLLISEVHPWYKILMSYGVKKWKVWFMNFSEIFGSFFICRINDIINEEVCLFIAYFFIWFSLALVVGVKVFGTRNVIREVSLLVLRLFISIPNFSLKLIIIFIIIFYF